MSHVLAAAAGDGTEWFAEQSTNSCTRAHAHFEAREAIRRTWARPINESTSVFQKKYAKCATFSCLCLFFFK